MIYVYKKYYVISSLETLEK